MYRNDTLNRYQLFLNEAIELANAGVLTSFSALREKYGVSGALLGFMKTKKIIAEAKNTVPGDAKYEAIRKNPFNVVETQMFIADFNRWKKNGMVTHGVTSEGKVTVSRKPPKKGSCLTDVTTREIITELKRRGYTGTLTIQKEIVL